MEENLKDVVYLNNIKCNCVAADIVHKKLHFKKSLSIPYSPIIHNNNNIKSTPPAVKIFDQPAKALGMSLRHSVTNGKVGQPAKRTPVLSNADSGATGNYIRLADINVLRDVRVSTPSEQIAVAVADGNLLHSTHHGFFDVWTTEP